MPGTAGERKEADMNYYGTSPKRWTVLTANGQLSTTFDLQANDVLEFTGNGNGDATSIVKRHRNGTTVDWGKECLYDATDPSLPKATGIHIASGTRKDPFELKISPKAPPELDQHTGNIKRGTGTGSNNGTWTAQEGG